MSNLFINLPLPAGNGAGASVASDLLGKDKTIVVGGSFPGATLTIEASVDGGTTWGQVATFQDGDGKLKEVPVVCDFMRVRVSGRTAVFSGVNVDVGANNNGTLFAALPFPVGAGAGASVDVSAFGLFKTIIMGGGTWARATASVQISEDGVSWAYALSFNQPGIKNFSASAQFARIFVTGAAIVGVTAGMGSEQAGGGDGSLEIQDEGLFVGDRPILNFTGTGVTATDDPVNNRVDVDIPGNDGTAILGFGDGNINSGANTRYLDPWYGGPLEVAGATIVEIAAPMDGTLRNLFVRHNSALGTAGTSVVYTVLKNGAPTALTVTLAADAVGQASDLVNSVAVVQGDLIALEAVKAVSIGNGGLRAVASMEVAA